MILHIGNVLYNCLLYPSSGHSGYVNSVAISADGTKVVSGSSDKTIKIWDTASGDVMQTLSGEGDMHMLCVHVHMFKYVKIF